MIRTNKAQRKVLFRKWQQDSQGVTYREFRATIQPMFMRDEGGILVKWCGMWLGIESDGYCHS